MTFRLPEALDKPDDDGALAYLRRYYEKRPGTPPGYTYSGARFGGWDSTVTRADDVNRFTADDLLAVTFIGWKRHRRASVSYSPTNQPTLMSCRQACLTKIWLRLTRTTAHVS